MRVEFTIPGDIVRDLGPNELRRVHWATRGRRVRLWRDKTWAECLLSHPQRHSFPGQVRVSFVIRRGRSVDLDNAAAACKAILDSLVRDLGMLRDDSPAFIPEAPAVRLETGKAWRLKPEVVVTIEEAE